VLDYPACRFYFFNSLDKNVVPEIAIPVPLGKLLLEAVRRAKDLPFDHLAADPDLRIDLSPDPLLRYQAVELNHDERRLLASISRSVSAQDLIAASAIPKEDAARALYALLVLGAVVSVPVAQPAESRTEKIDEAAKPEHPSAQ